MPTDIKTKQFLFVRKLLVVAPRRDRSLSCRCCRSYRFIEQRNLSGGTIAMCRGRRRERLVDTSEKFRAITPEEIERAHLDQTLEHISIGDASSASSTKIFQRSELPSSLPFLDGHFHGAFTDMLDRGETVADRHLSILRFRDEFQAAAIDVGRQNGDPHAFAFADEDRNFFGVVDFVTQQTGHKFNRIKSFEIGRVITDDAVSCAVVLDKSITGKVFEYRDDRVSLLL